MILGVFCQCRRPGDFQHRHDSSLVYCSRCYSNLESSAQIDVWPIIVRKQELRVLQFEHTYLRYLLRKIESTASHCPLCRAPKELLIENGVDRWTHSHSETCELAMAVSDE